MSEKEKQKEKSQGVNIFTAVLMTITTIVSIITLVVVVTMWNTLRFFVGVGCY